MEGERRKEGGGTVVVRITMDIDVDVQAIVVLAGDVGNGEISGSCRSHFPFPHDNQSEWTRDARGTNKRKR